VVTRPRKREARKGDFRDLEAQLCRVLMKTGAIRFGLFRLSGGKLTPYYVDLRMVPGDPNGLRTVMAIYEKMVRSSIGISSFDRIAAIPTAGVPYASILAYQIAKPFLYVRRELRPHAGERKVEGQIRPGERILLVDDLIATGNNMRQAAEAVRAEGGRVEQVLVLIDRQEGGQAALAKADVSLRAFMTISDIARRLRESGIVDDEDYKSMLAQVVRSRKFPKTVGSGN
jgi:orotate phosphoribosyltransferase